jgi:hypothetical protein
VAALVVLVGAVVVTVVGAVVGLVAGAVVLAVAESVSVSVPALVVDVLGDEVTVVAADDVVPGICLDTNSPSPAAAPAAMTATALDVRLTLPRAVSRRLAPDRSLIGVSCMVGMSPCESRAPRTVR